MFPIAGQTVRPNGLKFFVNTHGKPGLAKKFQFFSYIFPSFFFKLLFFLPRAKPGTSASHIYLSVCLGVWLFVSNKRLNDLTDRAQFFCGTSSDPREVYLSNLQKLASNKIKLWKFWKSTIFFYKNRKIIFGFDLQCIQREHVHNWNRRWARSALKA